jgi:hypothetical protein
MLKDCRALPHRLLAGGAALALLACWPSTAGAATLYTTFATGAQEVPANASTATATGNFTLNDAGDAFSYQITVSGLDFGPRSACSPTTAGCASPTGQDDVTIMHFHNAAAGANGPIVFDIIRGNGTSADADRTIAVDGSDPLLAVVSGVIDKNTDPFINGLDFDTFLSQINADSIYLNIHTVRFSGGEIRGQLAVVPEPTSLVGLAFIGLLGAAAKARCRTRADLG